MFVRKFDKRRFGEGELGLRISMTTTCMDKRWMKGTSSKKQIDET